ncbi:MAG: hypothetical protein C0615_03115 [Desulfuromonas sp.]|nr:MAG: hypothetical protein C0615_03115 [Desulfuromonas sp.]
MRLIYLLAMVALLLPTAVFAADSPEIMRCGFCTSIEEREPVDTPETIEQGQQTAYFFTEVANGSGQSLTHKWYFNDVPIAEIPLKVGTDRWRTWSTKQVWHLTPGTIKVQVSDTGGKILAEETITIQ